MQKLVSLWGEKNLEPYLQLQDLGTSEGFFSKFLTNTPAHFIWELPPGVSNISLLIAR